VAGDGLIVPISFGPSIGLLFGVTGSFVTAYHAILIKQSLPVVHGSTMDLMFYSNLYALPIMLPVAVLGGEMPELIKLMTGETPLGRLLWGTIITVSVSNGRFRCHTTSLLI
jgi:GDP-fucose transporter C1